jgi:Uma2 family endonuclease
MASLPSPVLNPERYLELDRQSERPNEYHDSRMVPIEAATINHGRIQGNLYTGLRERLKDTSCEAFLSSVRVSIPRFKRYTYPDLIVSRGTLELEDENRDTLLNPAVLFEILSPSTAGFDRGEKFALYRSIPSLKEYVMVSQDRVMVERYRRENEQNWHLEAISQLDATLRLEAVPEAIPLREIYDKVETTATLD